MRAILFLFIFFSFSLQAQNIWYVKNSGTGNGASWTNASGDLQSVINNAVDGDEVWIAEGTYQPAVNTAFILNKNVSLYGGFPNTGNPIFTDRNPHLNPTILSGNNEHVLRVIGTLPNYRISDTTIIDGFSITNGVSNYGGGMLVFFCDAEFRNLKIHNNTALEGEGGGVKIERSNSKFIQVLVVNNTSQKIPGTDGDSGGVRIDYSDPTFINCVITDNYAEGFIGGVYSNQNSKPKFYNTIIYGNTADVAFNSYYANDNFQGFYNFSEFKNCIIGGSGGSDNLFKNPKWKYNGIDLGGNWDVDPLFNVDYTVQVNSLAINKGDNALYPTANAFDLKQQNRFQDIIDIGVMEYQSPAHPILYVKQGGTGDGTSWVNASGDLQGMIDKQIKGNVVWVAKGTYEPMNGELYFKMRDGITIMGGFDDTGTPTLQDRDANLYQTLLTSEGSHIIGNYLFKDRFLNNTAVLDGFTLSQKSSDGLGAATLEYYSEAVYKNITFENFHSNVIYGEESNNTFINCTFKNNIPHERGGRLLDIQNSKAILKGCTFTGNDNYNLIIYVRNNSEIIIDETVFSKNFLDYREGGCIVYVSSSLFNINTSIFEGNFSEENRFVNNVVEIRNHSTGTIDHSIFKDNQTSALRIILSDEANDSKNISISNSLFYNNSRGAVTIFNGTGDVYFTNCTFTKNYKDNSGGGAISLSSGDVYLRNCILYDNDASIFYLPEVHYYSQYPNVNLFFQNSIVKGSGGSSNWDSQYFGNDLGGNLDIDPNFADVEANDFSLGACSPAINAGSNSFYGANLTPDLSGITTDVAGNKRFISTVDIGAFEFNGSAHIPTTYFVNASATGTNDGTSWQNAFTKIDSALGKACEGDEIWIAEGTYTPQKGKAYKMLNKVNMYGGFPSSGNPTMNDRNWNEYETILRGNESSVFVNYFSEQFPLTTETILDGFILENGVGTMVVSRGLAGGAICNTNASPTLRNLIIRNNSAYDGTAIYNLNNSNPILVNCLIHGNTNTGPNSVPNNAVILNVSTTDNTKLVNCTVVDNQDVAIRNYNAPYVLVYNTILFGNAKLIDYFGGPPHNTSYSLDVRYANSIVEDNWLNNQWDPFYGEDGGNNIDTIPMFTDYYRLSPESPAIDKGDNSIFKKYYDGQFDLQMSNRFQNNSIDIGAFELKVQEQTPDTPGEINIYPNPATDYVFIEFDSIELTSLKIFSIDGKMVLSLPITNELKVDGLSSGTYILCLYNNNQLVYSHKLVKK